jgi:hypothetical protein
MAAIYQWFIEGEVLLTTTLYPYEDEIEVFPELEVESVLLYEWPKDTLTFSGAQLVSAEIVPTLIETTGQDAVELNSYDLVNGEVLDILQDLDPGQDTLTVSAGFVDAELIDILIRAKSPEETINTTIAVEEIIYAPDP